MAQRYPTLIILLHWCTALLVVIAYVLSEDAEHFGNHPPALHFSLGLAVLVLTITRWATRRSTAIAPAQSLLRWVPARAVHTTLYLLLFAVPLTGWYVLSRMGLRVSVVGWNLPAIAMQAPDHASAVVGPVHQLAGTLLLIVAGLHAVVALWHQFVIKDKLMRRMNPF